MRYGVQQSADRTVEIATGDSSGGMYTISGLSAATEYTVEVAAVNSAGVGVYSDPIAAMTDGEQPSLHEFQYLVCLSVCLSVTTYTIAM